MSDWTPEQFVVQITGRSQTNAELHGSGFIISSEGIIATCLHVVRDAVALSARVPYHPPWQCRVIDQEPEHDLALLEGLVPPGGRTPFAVVNPEWASETLVGDALAAWGWSAAEHYAAPQRFALHVSGFSVHSRIGLSGSLNAGDSGGPIVNAENEVIGVAQARDARREGQAMAIPISLLTPLLERHQVRVTTAKVVAEPGTALPLERQGIPQLGRFFGRATDSEKLLDALKRETGPTVVLVGIGGVGKTALALEVARKLEGVVLAPVVWTTARDRPLTFEALLDAIARAWDFPYLMQLSTAAKEDEVRRLLPQRRSLLVIDNFDLVTDTEVERFVRSAPAPTRVLITSRERLSLPGALTVELSGLSKQTTRLVIDDAAERVGLHRGALTSAARSRLYTLTDGVPYAVEWAVALMKESASVSEILDQLEAARAPLFEEMFGRLWERLTDQERLVLMAVPRFAAPASRTALHAVCRLPRDEMPATVRRLRLLQLLYVDERDLDNDFHPRFFLHPLTRAFAANELRDRAPLADALDQRLARYYTQFAQRFGGGVEDENWESFDRLEGDWHNLAASLSACYDAGRRDLLLPMLKAVSRYLFVYGRWDARVKHCWDAVELITGARTVPSTRDISDNEARRQLVWLLRDIGRVSTNQDDFASAKHALERALTFALDCDDQGEVAFVRFHLGELAFRRGELDAAQAEWDASLRIALEQHLTRHIIGITYWLGLLALERNDPIRGEEILSANLDACRAEHWRRLEAYHLNHLGDIALEARRIDEARDHLRKAHAIVRNRDTRRRALTELSLGRLEQASGNRVAARRWIEQALRHFRFLGMDREERQAASVLGQLQ